IRLTRMDANGNTVRAKDYDVNGSFDNLQLIPSGQDHLFLVYVHWEQSRRHIDIVYLDMDLNEVWHHHMGYTVYNTLYAIAGENNGVEFIFNDPDNLKLYHFNMDINQNATEHFVEYKGSPDATSIIRKMVKTPDGGYLYTGVEIAGYKNEDILLVKTDQKGSTEWVKKHDLYMGDTDDEIAVTNDSYIMLARTGYSGIDLNLNAMDITLIKFDLAGDIVWTRAYGTATLDYPRGLLVNKDGSFTIGGQATTYYLTLTEPVIFKTDAQGNSPELSFQHPLKDPSPIVRAHPDATSPIQRMTGGALLPDGGMLMSTSILDTTVDWHYPYISRTDAQGNAIWHQPTPQGYESVMMKPMADGNFLSVSSWQEDFHITKLDADGKIDWTTTLHANYIKDAVMAADGGYLLTGMEYLGSGAITRSLLVIKLSKDGKELWRYRHTLDRKWIVGRSIQVTPENDILVAGFMQDQQSPVSASCLAKISDQGSLKWYKTYPHGNNIAAANKVIITSSNDYLLTGYIRYPADLHKQELLLLKADQQGSLLWEKEFDIDKMDAGTSVIEYGGQYYIAGTTGQPEFGARESFGLLLRTDVNGNKNGFLAFGNKSTLLTCTDLYKDNENKFHFLGTVQQPFGIERPFQAVLDHDIILSTSDPELNKNVQIYPIPAKYAAFVSIDHPYTGNIRVSITGITGVKLHSYQTQKTQRPFKLSLPIAGYANGVYLVEIQLGRERILKKLVISR
ncbi:MAG: T9SS type A sorting domain-containing protein, partial [Chitinophagaceae bacterium]|nr:T9SS type A sorting domain-containing protein [Chitinophagaceae bacterium]